MPYFEILGPRTASDRKRELSTRLTADIVAAFGVQPGTVTVFFQSVAADDYAHAGLFGLPPADARVLVKLHAFRRSPDCRRDLAERITAAIAACFDTRADNVAIYFFDRERDEVAHAGHLAGDESDN